MTCPGCGTVWELTSEEADKKTLICDECKTTFTIHPVLERWWIKSLVLAMTFIVALYVSGLICNQIIFPGVLSPYDPGPFYIGLIHFTLMIPTLVASFIVSRKLCRSLLDRSNVFVVSFFSLASSSVAAVIVDLCLKLYVGR